MKKTLNFIVHFLLIGVLMGSYAQAKPLSKDVDLKELTTLTLKFYPGMGTRFMFPFVLDKDNDYVPYTNNNTNDQVFVPIQRQEGRNFFVIAVPPDHLGKNDVGNMFVTVAGYQISVEMHLASKQSEHISDVRFTMSEAAKEELIQNAIQQRTKALEQSYADRFEKLDDQVERRALGRVGMLALYDPDIEKVKEEGTLKLKNGDETILFVDEVLVYPQYRIVSFNIENDSATNHVKIVDAKLFSLNAKTSKKIPLDISKEIPVRIEARGEAGGVIVVNSETLNMKNQLVLEVLTDEGSIKVTW